MKTVIGIIALCWSSITMGQAPIEGTWDTGVDEVQIQIYPTSEKWEGKIITCEKAPQMVGKIVVRDLKKVGSHWEGEIYVARRDMWLDAIIEPQNQELAITASVGFLRKTKVWEKVK
jgi:uncharacterized protein (DUF2147 family)